MIGEVLSVGDEVVIDIPEDSREWGYNPRPNGAHAQIVGFSTMTYGRVNSFGRKPGVYASKTWVTIKDEYGDLDIGTCYLNLAYPVEYQRRVTSWREHHQKSLHEAADFVGELPETPFWEGDNVRYVPAHVGTAPKGPNRPVPLEEHTFVVARIDYECLGDCRQDGSPYPAYQISPTLDAGWHRAASVNELTLIERGNVWKYYHGEPLSFADWTEEANFFLMVGETEEVCNPATDTFTWSLPEALTAIQQGIGDAITNGANKLRLFLPPSISVIKYRDRDLGRRVAVHMLEYFGNPS